MEKKAVFWIAIAIASMAMLFSLASSVSAETGCILNISMINQDPYPAIPGDYVKLVFQIDGVDNPECGEVSITLNQEFPFTLDPGVQSSYSTSTFYQRDYRSILVAPFKVRVDREALDGANPIEVAVGYSKSGMKTVLLEKFNVEIEDKRADFELYVKNYDTLTNTLTLEVLNVGKADIKSLTLKIPDQENISIKGSNTNLLGDLDSNDYTTADFEATSSGGKVNIEITYTDEINVRRS